jgi:hypothetical protein
VLNIIEPDSIPIPMIDALPADRAHIVDFDAQIQDLKRSLSVLRNQMSGRSRATRFLQVPGPDVAGRNHLRHYNQRGTS